ncbi:MAG: ribosome-associated translation inhibitor RaiA [Betaproteobacteria bacterium]|nr:ribosome-associated translation inhibitor RaiA [Betaproteobacteria bacterium]
MQTALQITFRDMTPSEALETRIRDKVAKLEKFHPHITSCRVTVEESHRHQSQGRHFGVKVEVHVPGGTPVVASLKHDEDVYVALRDAVGSARRRLEEDRREKRGSVKAHETPRHGKVARVFADEGFGFIQTDDGREFYFSRDNVVHPRFEDLGSGAAVQFIEEAAAEGIQAKRVSGGKHHF